MLTEACLVGDVALRIFAVSLRITQSDLGVTLVAPEDWQSS